MSFLPTTDYRQLTTELAVEFYQPGFGAGVRLRAWIAAAGALPCGVGTCCRLVVRAAVMGAIVLLGPVVCRRYDPLAALTMAGAGMLVFDPDVLADPGFQLSYLAMWGITVLAPPLAGPLDRVKVPGVLSYPLVVGVAAQIATLPLQVLLFTQVSIVSLPATLTAEVALLPLMLSGIATALLGLLAWSIFAWSGGLVVWLSSWWLIGWVEWWAAIPWAAFPVEGFNQIYAIAYYAALFPGVWVFCEARRRDRLAALWPQIRLAALGAVAAAVWLAAILMVILR